MGAQRATHGGSSEPMTTASRLFHVAMAYLQRGKPVSTTGVTPLTWYGVARSGWPSLARRGPSGHAARPVRLIHGRIVAKSAPPPFHYFDKATMAVIGRGFAVLQSGRQRLSGFLAWLAWIAVHLEFLAQSSLRVSVFVQWMWTYLMGQRALA